MLPQGLRRRWYDGWQITAAAAALLSVLAYALIYPVESAEYIFATDPEILVVSFVSAVLGALCWLPVAYVTWRPYVITEPGLDSDE